MTEAVEPVELRPTTCAICGTFDDSDELYPATFDASSLRPEIFSARRLPDHVHFRFVRCRRCGLVRSDPIVDPELLGSLYAGARLSYGGETAALRATYGRYLRRLEGLGVRKGRLLDIGCGAGFMLQEALDQGYEGVRGVEPARAVAEAAEPRVRAEIAVGLFEPGLFAPESFDVVTIFQTFDHLPDPNGAAAETARILRPGGLLLCLNHDVGAWSSRILGERSPIFDIEHTYLYSRDTLGRILKIHGLQPVASGSVLNRYSLRYFAQLPPLPKGAKQQILTALDRTHLGRLPLAAPLGNLWLAARKL